MKTNSRHGSKVIDLLGVVHREPYGYRRTLKALEDLNPDLVLVELSAFAWDFRTRHRRFLLETFHRHLRVAARRSAIPLRDAFRHPRIRAIQRQILLPYEWRAVRHFTAATGRAAFLIDCSSFSRTWIHTWPELVSPNNLSVLLHDRADQPNTDPYLQAIRTLDRIPDLPPDRPQVTDHHRWGRLQRELYLHRQIEAGVAVFRPTRLLYIGGWRHLLWETDAGPTIRWLLLEHRPRIHLLCQFH